jgi:uncharacterized protein with PIN domain
MDVKECPLCGETMHLVDRELVDKIPGSNELKRRKTAEWVCAECDHFEEVDPDDLR